ncbi:MAG: bifunctional adenosylcobinamide kinase/adenosylcobinamide-phosphate guanylyltransferase [Desulfuromonadaceae bacterium]|nr:bifunctional adenosylcobinamide kinase/adenosylcobinamide-phosphate guanylyltransferase [Desulfuromonadaceae bacterium]
MTLIATCPVIDKEMNERIARHRFERQGRGWETREAPEQLIEAVRQAGNEFDVLLIDCLTLWVNNLFYRAQQEKLEITEQHMTELSSRLVRAWQECGKSLIVVSNELGMGLVPTDSASRLYRDLVGRCNQTVAAAATEAIFMVSGRPVPLNRS